MNYRKLEEGELKGALNDLKGWKVEGGKLCKEFSFKDFTEAFSFISKVALEAEKLNHHPDIYNSYNRVKIELITHAIGAISDLDVELAKRIENRFGNSQG